MTMSLPHDPYITAVVEALTAAGLEPDDVWTSDTETDPRGDGCTMMLNAVLVWNGDNTDVNGDVPPDGMLLLWEHSADEWQFAARRENGSNNEPEFLPSLPQLAHPVGVCEVARELLAGRPAPAGARITWHRATDVRTAIDEWVGNGDAS